MIHHSGYDETQENCRAVSIINVQEANGWQWQYPGFDELNVGLRGRRLDARLAIGFLKRRQP
jgi:hypothetical protein